MLVDDAFTNLSAEYEGDWLPTAYIEPANMNMITSMRSMIVVGESGAGKSALRSILAHQSVGNNGPHRLVVEWRFTPTFEPVRGSQLVRKYAQQVFAACARALLRVLASWPLRLSLAHHWVSEAVYDFLRSALGAELARTVAQIERIGAPEVTTILRPLQQDAPTIHPIDDIPEVISELSALVQELKMNGVWVLVDRLEPWLGADPGQVTEAFHTMLETLGLFEAPGFVFKLFAPPELSIRLTGASGVGRRRLDIIELAWKEHELTAMVDARLRLALGRNDIDLGALCESTLLEERLRLYGGQNPRSWLELTRPFVERAMTVPGAVPLSSEVCTEIHYRHPPYLRMNLRTDQVYIGEQELTELQPTTRRLLHYLYQHHDRIVSRIELYFCGHRNLNSVPEGAEEGWDGSEDWKSSLDTALYRLRRQVEPNPSSPLYVITTPTGVRLQNVL